MNIKNECKVDDDYANRFNSGRPVRVLDGLAEIMSAAAFQMHLHINSLHFFAPFIQY